MFDFSPLVYIRITREQVSLIQEESGDRLDEPPLVAITRTEPRRIQAVGTEAVSLRADSAVEVVNPFDQPRAPLTEFNVATKLLQQLVGRLLARQPRLFQLLLRVIIHLAFEPEGGLTEVERRLLHELGLAIGARKVWVIMGVDSAATAHERQAAGGLRRKA